MSVLMIWLVIMVYLLIANLFSSAIDTNATRLMKLLLSLSWPISFPLALLYNLWIEE